MSFFGLGAKEDTDVDVYRLDSDMYSDGTGRAPGLILRARDEVTLAPGEQHSMRTGVAIAIREDLRHELRFPPQTLGAARMTRYILTNVMETNQDNESMIPIANLGVSNSATIKRHEPIAYIVFFGVGFYSGATNIYYSVSLADNMSEGE